MKFFILFLFVCISFCGDISAVVKKWNNMDIERAGTLLVKSYGNQLNDQTLLLGHDHAGDYWNFPAGGVDKSDSTPLDTVSRELEEETGGSLKIASNVFGNFPYVYSGHHKILLFVKRNDSLSVTDLTKSCQKAIQNNNLSKAYKEVDKYTAIPIKNILDAAALIEKANFPSTNDIINGKKINGLNLKQINKYTAAVEIMSRNKKSRWVEYRYVSVLAKDLTKAKKIFNQLFEPQNYKEDFKKDVFTSSFDGFKWIRFQGDKNQIVSGNGLLKINYHSNQKWTSAQLILDPISVDQDTAVTIETKGNFASTLGVYEIIPNSIKLELIKMMALPTGNNSQKTVLKFSRETGKKYLITVTQKDYKQGGKNTDVIEISSLDIQNKSAQTLF
jgi:8-oxo-dGTP pyrophosphatase MutT (NUDIX family)